MRLTDLDQPEPSGNASVAEKTLYVRRHIPSKSCVQWDTDRHLLSVSPTIQITRLVNLSILPTLLFQYLQGKQNIVGQNNPGNFMIGILIVEEKQCIVQSCEISESLS
jgi:hypothetical protein